MSRAEVQRRRREERRTNEALEKINNTSLQESIYQNNLYNYGDEGRAAYEEWAASDAGQADLRRRIGKRLPGHAGRRQVANARSAQEEAFVRGFVNSRGERVLENLGGSNNGDGTSASSPSIPPRQEIKPSFSPTEDFQVNTELTERNFGVSRIVGGRFDISKFRSEVAYNNLPTHSFLVQFAPMQWVNEIIKTNEMLTMRCENAIMPTVSMLQFDNLRRYGYGPIENTPYGYNMGDFTLQFLVDKNAQVVDFFEEWNNFIINRKSFGGANMNGDTPGVSPYELKFKDEFACPVVTVFVYDRSQNNIFEYNMYDVYPNTIQSVNLSWSDENQLMRLNVGFAFTDMQIKTTESLYTTNALDPLEELVNKNLQDVQQQVQNTIAEVSALNTSVPVSLGGTVDPINQPIAIGTGELSVNNTEPSGETTVTTTNEIDINDGQITGSSSWEITSNERTSGTRTTTTLNTPLEWV